MKPLYGVSKAGNHWFATYHTYHKDKLGIKKSSYNPCFFYSSGPFDSLGIQTNNTLILANKDVASKEDKEIKNTKIMKKNWEHFTSSQPLKFNEA